MTISEAQSILHCPDAYGGIYGEKYGQALEIAFKSLEAWDKVKADIRLFIDTQKTQTVCPTDKRDALAVDCLKVMSISTAEDCFDIIDKHLKEVEE